MSMPLNSENESKGPSQIRKPRILVVDDEVAMVRSLELLLRPVGDVVKAYSVPEAEEALADSIDCIITDVAMPEGTGLELLEKVRKKNPDIPVIVMTAYSSVPQAVETMRRGAFEYVMKPFENKDLLASVKRAIERKGVLVGGGSFSIPAGWVCNSDAMKNFIMKADKCALAGGPVLLVGQRGAGKKRSAEWMHERRLSKPKRDSEFMVWSALGRDNANSEINLSRYASLYVEEVFNISSPMQDRLMQVLDEGKIFVVGGTSSSPELQTLPDFRRDLFERLSAQVLHIPSLKERAADFEALVRQLLEDIRTRMRLKELVVDPQALRALRDHTFVGNVRELESVLERSTLEIKRGTIGQADLRFETPDLSRQLPFTIPVDEGWGKLEYLARSLEKDLIERAIQKNPEASNTQIAQVLGTTRRILELRMKAYEIRSPEREST